MTQPSPLLAKFIKLYGYRPTEFDKRYLEYLDMGNYRVLPVPDVSPGKCCNCGASRNDGRQYLDTGRHVEWYGAIFFCGLCMREFAEALGLLNIVRAELEETKALLVTQEALANKGEMLHEVILKTFEEVKEYYAGLNLHPVGDNPSSDPDPSVEPDKAAETKPATNETKSRATKSTSGSGRTNLPSLAELLNAKPD